LASFGSSACVASPGTACRGAAAQRAVQNTAGPRHQGVAARAAATNNRLTGSAAPVLAAVCASSVPASRACETTTAASTSAARRIADKAATARRSGICPCTRHNPSAHRLKSRSGRAAHDSLSLHRRRHGRMQHACAWFSPTNTAHIQLHASKRALCALIATLAFLVSRPVLSHENEPIVFSLKNFLQRRISSSSTLGWHSTPSQVLTHKSSSHTRKAHARRRPRR
jgi:hypothetical protein